MYGARRRHGCHRQCQAGAGRGVAIAVHQWLLLAAVVVVWWSSGGLGILIKFVLCLGYYVLQVNFYNRYDSFRLKCVHKNLSIHTSNKVH